MTWHDLRVSREGEHYLACRTHYARPVKPLYAPRCESPRELFGEDDAERIEEFRRIMRDVHGLDMSREGGE